MLYLGGMTIVRRPELLAVAVAAAAVIAARPAPGIPAATEHSAAARTGVRHGTTTSSNWAGYASTGRTFAAVSATWIQPAASCTGGSTSAAFWVGLGGFTDGSRAIEQIGTEVNCDGPNASYAAWYELLPAPSVYLNLPVAPGDKLSAVVMVTGHTVFLRLRNVTRNAVFARKLRLAAPDRSSAEWVAEAPAVCSALGTCHTLPLANFGRVVFTHAVASARGHTGKITDPRWSASAIELRTETSTGSAALPSPLAAAGSAFAITWQPPPSS
jgi:hypothetical protein